MYFIIYFNPNTDGFYGRRIVDLFYIFDQIQSNVYSGGFDCSFMNMKIISEKKNGFQSKFTFKCQICGISTIINSENKKGQNTYLPIIEAVVSGTIAIGIEYSQLAEFSAILDIPYMSSTSNNMTFKPIISARNYMMSLCKK